MDVKIAFVNLALNKLIAFQRAFQAMEQRFVPIAVQTLGYRFTWRFDPSVTQGGKLLWISLSGNNGPHDAQARFSGNIADDISQLHIHLEERLLHVMNRFGVADYQIVV